MSYSMGYGGDAVDVTDKMALRAAIAPKPKVTTAAAPPAAPAPAAKKKAPVKLISSWLLGTVLLAWLVWKYGPETTRR